MKKYTRQKATLNSNWLSQLAGSRHRKKC